MGKTKIENTSNLLLKKKINKFEELKKEKDNLENELKNNKNQLRILSNNLKKWTLKILRIRLNSSIKIRNLFQN